MVTGADIIAKVKAIRTQWAEEGVQCVNHSKSLQFQFGVMNGRDEAFNQVIETITGMISEEDDQETD